MGDVRECRLRQGCRHLYERLVAGVWKPAGAVAEILVERARKACLLTIHRPAFDGRQFEFRDGDLQPRWPVRRRPRTQDLARAVRQS